VTISADQPDGMLGITFPVEQDFVVELNAAAVMHMIATLGTGAAAVL
jgi:hypothetical protein